MNERKKHGQENLKREILRNQIHAGTRAAISAGSLFTAYPLMKEDIAGLPAENSGASKKAGKQPEAKNAEPKATLEVTYASASVHVTIQNHDLLFFPNPMVYPDYPKNRKNCTLKFGEPYKVEFKSDKVILRLDAIETRKDDSFFSHDAGSCIHDFDFDFPSPTQQSNLVKISVLGKDGHVLKSAFVSSAHPAEIQAGGKKIVISLNSISIAMMNRADEEAEEILGTALRIR